MISVNLLGLTLRASQRRLAALVAFAGLALSAAALTNLLVRDEHGHVNVDLLFLLGGETLVSALLLLGWLLGRFPMIAVLVLLAGLVSQDRAAGYTRMLAVRPVSPLAVYGVRFGLLAGLAFLVSALLLPAFDLILIGEWAGPATLVLILAYVLVYGGLVALLSVWTRADAWIVLLLAIAAMVWDAMRRADVLAIAPGARELIAFLLPPQAALHELEGAFAAMAPIPWDAFAFAAGYGIVALGLAAVSLARREL